MKFSVLASGSRGNSSYIETPHVRILVDLGISCAKTCQKLKSMEVEPDSIHGILLTHTHVDHVNGLRVFMKKYHTKLYLTKLMYDELSGMIELDNYQLIDGDFTLEDLNVHVIKTSHDVADSNGYLFEASGKTLVYITDTGYINVKYHKELSNKNYYIMESNHDVELLMNGKYPYHLKQRILSDLGHLSNKDSSYYLSKFIGENTQGVVLIHLSEENNEENLALESLEHALSKRNKQLKQIMISKQNERTELVEV